MTIRINGGFVQVTGQHADKAIASSIFKDWVKRLDPDFVVHSIDFQSVDFAHLHADRIFFIKFKAHVVDEKGKLVLPGIVFMRGGAVSIMPVLRCDDGKTYTIFTRQPRFAVGHMAFPEIPAGMLDGEGNFAGVAARELQEELDMTIQASDLQDLGAPVYGECWPGIYPSPGACDEFIKPFFFEKAISAEKLQAFRGKRTGLATENEQIVLEVIPLKDLPWATSDGKSLASLALLLARSPEFGKMIEG